MAPTLKFQSYTRYNVSFLKKKYIGNNHEFETVCFSNGFNSRVAQCSTYISIFFSQKFCKIPSQPLLDHDQFCTSLLQLSSASSSRILADENFISGAQGFIETVPPCSERRRRQRFLLRSSNFHQSVSEPQNVQTPTEKFTEIIIIIMTKTRENV